MIEAGQPTRRAGLKTGLGKSARANDGHGPFDFPAGGELKITRGFRGDETVIRATLTAFVLYVGTFWGFVCPAGGAATETVDVPQQKGSRESADRILQATNVAGGLIVHLGCGDGRLTKSLSAGDGCLVHGLDADADNVRRAREYVRSRGAYGAVSIERWSGRRLPYVDNLVNLLVAEDLGEVSVDEVMRVLRPHGTAIVSADQRPAAGAESIEISGIRWWKLVKPRPAEIDEWTHFLYEPDNNAVSHDRLVGPPRCLHWASVPVYGRHHDRLSSVSAVVSAGGRLFSIEDRGPALSIGFPADWRLIARDAFNGLTLWERPIKKWESTGTGFRSGPVQLARRLVAVGDRVYVALNYGDSLSCLDAATGATLKTYDRTEGVDEILYLDGTLYLVAAAADRTTGRRILAVDASSGEIHWHWQNRDRSARSVLPATLAVGGQHLFFHDRQAVVALDRKTGRAGWRTPLPSVSKRPNWSSPTIVYHGGVVLCGDRAKDYPPQWKRHPGLLSGMLQHGGLGVVTALAAADGKRLWQREAAECFHNAVDVFVIDGLVWASRGPARFFFERTRPILAGELGEDFYVEDVVGRDLRSGEVRKTIDAAEAFTLSHHHRCYRNKATDRFIIMGRTGVELINLTGGPSLRHNWTRGACQYGVLPANGLLYVPPHPCACYNASKMNGFFAYSSRKEAMWMDLGAERLRKGPAHNELGVRNAAGGTDGRRNGFSGRQHGRSDDWPTYRRDLARSGCASTRIVDRLTVAWRRELRGKLSAPTSADDKVFVSAVDRHTIFALDLTSGEALWSYTAGGRVDSPPTYWRGRIYFGSANGSIYCVRADDGAPIWQFMAAPQQTSIVVRDQLVAGTLGSELE